MATKVLMEALSPTMEEGRLVEWKIGPLPMVRGDAAMLRQVLVNLLENALKFTRPRSPAIVEIGCTPSVNELTFFVRDNGIGIDPRDFERIFVIFQRMHTRGEYPGTGLGLAICKRIIERHNGRIWVESSSGQGATFFFTLPGGENQGKPA